MELILIQYFAPYRTGVLCGTPVSQCRLEALLALYMLQIFLVQQCDAWPDDQP